MKGNNSYNLGDAKDLDGFPWSKRYMAGPGERPAMIPGVAAPKKFKSSDTINTPEFRAAREKFDSIQSVLKELPDDEATPETAVELPLGQILQWIPERYVMRPLPDVSLERHVSIMIDDLFGQLASGNVTVSIAALVLDVPPGCVVSEAHQDTTGQATLPLSVVVGALDPQLLVERTAAAPLDIDMSSLPDPFKDPEGEDSTPAGTAETDTPDAAERTAPLIEEPERTAAGDETEPLTREPTVQVRVEYQRPNIPAPEEKPVEAAKQETGREWIDVEAEQEDRLGGVNINVADENQLLTLDSMTPALARHILEYRSTNGQFRSVFDLIHVPQLGRVRFRRMTGMPFSTCQRHRIRKLIKLLGLLPGEAHRLPSVVTRVLSRPGFAGCVISDHDGLLLAQQGADERASAMSAVIPRLFGQLDTNLAEMETEAAVSISICVGEQMLTIVRSRQIYLTVVHDRRKLTKGELTFARRVTDELAWLLGHRAYAGMAELLTAEEPAMSPDSA